jgi:hypothetical protein
MAHKTVIFLVTAVTTWHFTELCQLFQMKDYSTLNIGCRGLCTLCKQTWIYVRLFIWTVKIEVPPWWLWMCWMRFGTWHYVLSYICTTVPLKHRPCLPNCIAWHPRRQYVFVCEFVNCHCVFNTRGSSKKQSNERSDAENFILIFMYTWHICSKLYTSDHWHLSICPTVAPGLVFQLRETGVKCHARWQLASHWRCKSLRLVTDCGVTGRILWTILPTVLISCAVIFIFLYPVISACLASDLQQNAFVKKAVTS